MNPVQALAGRVVLVTGAHGGLGSETALACAQAGARVVLLGRRVPRLERLDDAIRQAGGEAALYPLDLAGADPDAFATLAERLEQTYGQLDGIAHCAAEFAGLTPLEHTDPAAFARALHVNLTARWWLTQACLPVLRRAQDAAVVFVIDPQPGVQPAYWGGYGMAQHGQRMLMDMLRGEAGQGAVRWTGLTPAPMRTALRARAYAERDDFHACAPTQAAQACVRLLSPAGKVWAGRIASCREVASAA